MKRAKKSVKKATARSSKKSSGKKSAKTRDWTKALIEAVWPQERDFFQRPERYRYVRKLLPPNKECVFCSAGREGLGFETLVLFKGKHCMVLMNKYPYNSGHLLVMPTAHVANIWDLNEEQSSEVADWLKRSTKVLKEAFNCPGFNLGLNHGAVAGAGIPDHLHWHIIPRWAGDVNFFPLIAETKVLAETLEGAFARLAPLFKKEAQG